MNKQTDVGPGRSTLVGLTMSLDDMYDHDTVVAIESWRAGRGTGISAIPEAVTPPP